MRFAKRQAKYNAGFDFDKVMNSEPHVLDGWIASEELDPVFDPEVLYEILKIGFAALCNVWGCDVTPDQFDPRKEQTTKPTPVVASPDQAAMMMKGLMGSG